jgi:hypothetical protein
MTRVTCADYLAMPPHQFHLTSAWMSGWFNEKSGYVWIDLGDSEKKYRGSAPVLRLAP